MKEEITTLDLRDIENQRVIFSFVMVHQVLMFQQSLTQWLKQAKIN